MLKIKYIVFKRLGKTDLDVLQNAEENTGHTFLLGKTKDGLMTLLMMNWFGVQKVKANMHQFNLNL